MNVKFDSNINKIKQEYNNCELQSNNTESSSAKWVKWILGIENLNNAYSYAFDKKYSFSKKQKILNVGTELIKGTGKILIVATIITGGISQVATKQGIINPYEKLGFRHACEFTYKLASKAIDKISGVALSIGVKEHLFSESKPKDQVKEDNIPQNTTFTRNKKINKINKQQNKRFIKNNIKNKQNLMNKNKYGYK